MVIFDLFFGPFFHPIFGPKLEILEIPKKGVIFEKIYNSW